MAKVKELKIGATNRVGMVEDFAGGKGYNVARALGRLGVPVTACGILFNEDRQIFEEALSRDHVRNGCVLLPGRSRINLKIYDQKNAVVTELNENGKGIDQASVAAVECKIKEHIKTSKFIILSGSVAPGIDTGIYSRIIALANESNCRAVVDADSALLSTSVEALPFMIKPNRAELEFIAGKPLHRLEEIKAAAVALVRKGIGIVAVSLAELGALIANGAQACYAPALKLEVKSTVGAGDSMLAGMIFGIMNNKPLDEILKLGMASASSSVIHDGTHLTDIASMQSFYSDVNVYEI
jgi:1-phosphofructokinase